MEERYAKGSVVVSGSQKRVTKRGRNGRLQNEWNETGTGYEKEECEETTGGRRGADEFRF